MNQVLIALVSGIALLAGPALEAKPRLTPQQELSKLLEGRVAGVPVRSISQWAARDTPAIPGKVPNSVATRAATAKYRWTDFGTEGRLKVLRGANPAFGHEVFVGLFTPGAPVDLAAGVSASARVVGAPGTTGAAAQLIQRGARIVVEIQRLSNLRQVPQFGPGAPLVECIIAENDISTGSWVGQIQIFAGSELVYGRKQADASKAGFPNFFAFADRAPGLKADRAVFTWTVGDAPKPAGKFGRLGQCRLIWVTLPA